MQKAIDYFYTQFEKINSGQEIGEIIEKISLRLLFTTIYIGDEVNAYKVFETLNARGVQLSSGDLLKNYIFSIIDKDTQTPDEVLDELEEKWNQIGKNLDESNYTQYILAEWNSRNNLVRKANLFSSIKKEITDIKLAKTYLDRLEGKSYHYAALLDHENDFWKDVDGYEEIKRDLAFLRLFNIKQPYSLLLAVYEKMPKKFSTVLKWIKVFSLRYNVICGRHPGDQQRLYNSICLIINKNADLKTIKEKLLELYPKDEAFKQAFSDKTMPTEQSNKKARYLLARLEEKESNASIDEGKLTVEHILLKNPNDQWKIHFGENWNLFYQRVGNMALVNANVNDRLDQQPFKNKKTILLKSNYKINQNLETYQVWDSSAVESRQKKLAEIAARLWRIS